MEASPEARTPPPPDLLALRAAYELLDAAPAPLFAFDVETGEVVACNQVFATLLGRAKEEVLGRPLAEFHPPEDHHTLVTSLDLLKEGGDTGAVELRAQRVDGARAPVSFRATAGKTAAGWEAARGVWTDLEPRLRVERGLRDDNVRLRRMVHADPLTNVLNRRGLERMLHVEVARSKRTSNPLCAVLLDCDDFKSINEKAGLAGGDAVLVEVATRLSRSVRANDHLGRIGGDEFLVLLPGTSLAEAKVVAEKLRSCVAAHPLRWEGKSLEVTASLGVMEVGPKVLGIEQVLTTGHFALTRSKGRGKNRVTGPFQLPLEIPGEQLLQAVVAGSAPIRIVGQPIHRTGDGRAVAYEMLSRFPSEDGMGPLGMFRLAVDSQVLTPVDLRCLTEATAFAAGISHEVSIHVNLFPSTLLNTHPATLLSMFPASQRERFCIELSEQQLIGDPKNLLRSLEVLRGAGLKLAIDDVGYGQTVLESLVELDPEWIKIDGRRITGVGEAPSMVPSLERLVAMLRPLGVNIVAEGVESLDDLTVVRDLGITHAQGFLWGQPA